MLQKIILVHYINVAGKSPAKAREIMMELRDMVLRASGEDSKEIISYFVPIQNGDSRIECIYPKQVSVAFDQEPVGHGCDCESCDCEDEELLDETLDEDEDINEIIESDEVVEKQQDDSKDGLLDLRRDHEVFSRTFIDSVFGTEPLFVPADDVIKAFSHITPDFVSAYNKWTPTRTPKPEPVKSEIYLAAKAGIMEILNARQYKHKTAEEKARIEWAITEILGPVAPVITELHEKLAQIKIEKNNLVKQQSYEPAARMRDHEKTTMRELEALQAGQPIPYTNMEIELSDTYPMNITVKIHNGILGSEVFSVRSDDYGYMGQNITA